MMVFEVKDKLLLAINNEQMNADKALEDPSGSRFLGRLSLLVWKTLLVLFEALANAVLQGGVDKEADGHHHHERHDPLRALEEERGSQEHGIFEETKAALYRGLTLVAREDLVIRQGFFIEFIRG